MAHALTSLSSIRHQFSLCHSLKYSKVKTTKYRHTASTGKSICNTVCTKKQKGQTNFYLQMWISVASNRKCNQLLVADKYRHGYFLTAQANLQQRFTQTRATLIICYRLIIALRSCVRATLQSWDIAEPRKLDFYKSKPGRMKLAATHKAIQSDILSKDNKMWAENIVNPL